MNLKEFNDIFANLFKNDKAIYEQQKKQAEQRRRNMKAWDKADDKLDEIQGNERSAAYRALQAFSMSSSVIGMSMYDKLVNELTDAEKKVLNL